MPKSGFDAYAILKKIREQKPVVHHLTNWVTIYDCAQVVKTLGASPVMAHAPEEVEQMAGIASALVLNIGTLTREFIDAMKKAAAAANAKGIPVVLDVCGAGATSLRDAKVNEILSTVKVSVIKGNASEIARVSGAAVTTKGVDAGSVHGDLLKLASDLALAYKAVVVVTGAEDIVTDGKRHIIVKNGHPMMSHVVGTGCMAASVIGTFAAVEKDLVRASAAALVCYEVAAQVAVEHSAGPGTFKEKLFDCLYQLDRGTIQELQKVSA